MSVKYDLRFCIMLLIRCSKQCLESPVLLSYNSVLFQIVYNYAPVEPDTLCLFRVFIPYSYVLYEMFFWVMTCDCKFPYSAGVVSLAC